MLVTAILAWLHILSAMSWLGGGFFFFIVIGPGLATLAPASSGEFILKIIPRVIRFFQIVAGLTVLFGVLLLGNITGGDFGSVSPTASTYGLEISLGILFAATAFIVSEFVAIPAFSRIVRIVRTAHETGQPPSGLPAAMKWGGQISLATLVLLLVTLAFMVGAGFY